MKRFDQRDDVLLWASEELSIPYRSPIDRRTHRYFPDFLIKVRTKDGSTKTIMIEVKPHAQTQPPEKQKRRTQRYLQEVATYAINQRKWEAAEKYCSARGWDFQVITEKDVNFG